MKSDYENGLKCEYFGKSISEMDKYDLISFIGFLDDLLTQRQTTIQLLDAKMLASNPYDFKATKIICKPKDFGVFKRILNADD